MSETSDGYLGLKPIKKKERLTQKIAHDDKAKPISVKQCRNGVSVRWACGCSIFAYNTGRAGRQLGKHHFCQEYSNQMSR